MAAWMTPLAFPVRLCKPELISPARPTPHELKKLSDLDDQEGHRFLSYCLHLYQCDPSLQGKDPVRVIRDALAQTLVFYYPMAGRLREESGRKLVLDCTGEGILFVEANADAELLHFGDPPAPPFPCLEELLYDIPGSSGILDVPLLHVQVTRLKCGGFVLAFRFNHTISDGIGIGQFWNAVCEMARGAGMPSISPVWKREIFKARNPPRVTCMHREYDQNSVSVLPFKQHDDLVECSFFFGSLEISTIRESLPNRIKSKYTNYEILTAFLWRCRTKALELDPKDEVRLFCPVNIRGGKHFPVPIGYYGNAFVSLAAVTSAEKLCNKSLEYLLDLVREINEKVTKEYIQPVVDLLVIKGRPLYSMVQPYFVSDVTHIGFDEMDFGWGKPVFCGPTTNRRGFSTYYLSYKNKVGEVGRLVPICLHAHAMNIFVMELHRVLGHGVNIKKRLHVRL